MEGVFDLEALRVALEQGADVVSCMWVNNETGLRLPIPEIAAECRRYGAPLHSDAVQAVGKIPLSLAEVPLDMVTVTGHKIYGPKGTGALVVRTPELIRPLHFGGGQEGGLRPGTGRRGRRARAGRGGAPGHQGRSPKSRGGWRNCGTWWRRGSWSGSMVSG